MPALTEKLEELLNNKFSEKIYAHLFLVEIQQLPQNTVQVYIDSDEGLSLEHCKEISRYLESFLDENGWLGEKYTLEVSSPGIGNPLKLKRQYLKNIGRTVAVELHDSHIHIKGVLEEVLENQIVVSYSEKVKIEGKKKKKEVIVQRNILFENIKKTVVKITF